MRDPGFFRWRQTGSRLCAAHRKSDVSDLGQFMECRKSGTPDFRCAAWPGTRNCDRCAAPETQAGKVTARPNSKTFSSAPGSAITLFPVWSFVKKNILVDGKPAQADI